ncbi:spore germination protein [Vermiculatibacterium agrestimuris]|uniref:spore germination protein n=1 Tax=Vermiculatibacterium agrestimuris TaxID=2941519 RepID=UPI0020413C84|nr:spore germination protein [Vermiculatibacterium agrestimuris]
MGFFQKRAAQDPPHPRREPRLAGPLTPEALGQVFENCVDYSRRSIAVGGNEAMRLELIFIAGMVRMERVSDYVLRPLAQDAALGELGEAVAWEKMRSGALYSLSVSEVTTLDKAVGDLVDGNCLLIFPGKERALSFNVGTEEKRSIGEPEDEVAVKGPKDSFVENLRTNTSLVRRHLKAPELRITEQVVGRQSLTPVDILWLEGIADPDTVKTLQRRMEDIDIDALLATGNLEEYIVDDLDTAFPLVQSTQRPDRFCYGLCQGRVGVLMEGIPLGYLAPGVIGDFLRAPEDRAENWMVATALTALRWVCLLLTLFLPGLYVAMVSFHPEMIPARLALSIMAARRDVPFSALFETLLLLAAFEVLQEAGLRLPQSIGQTVSILGGLVVGSAAVEAKLISPAVLVVVAIAGIAGYTMPSQDLAGALRLWRFFAAALSGLAGLFGLAAGAALLVGHLAGLESFGVPYLTPFTNAEPILRQPLTADKLRPAHLNSENRRKQR